MLDPAEARMLLDSIDVSTHAGLRDRALIGLMVYSFARVGAALGMTVEDVYTQNYTKSAPTSFTVDGRQVIAVAAGHALFVFEL